MKQQREGYVLVLTLTVISLLVIIATQMYYLSTGFSSFSRVVIKREEAKMLALSGVQLICDRLYLPAPKKEKKDTVKDQKSGPAPQRQASQQDESQNVLLLQQVLPMLNRWQAFPMSEKKGVDAGEIKVYVACEDGKLHLNNLLSLMSQKGLGPERVKLIQMIWKQITQSIGAKKNLYEAALNLFERRNRIWLNDITELLEAPAFQVFDGHVFVGLSNSKKDKVSLMDLFTPQSRYGKLDPWVLSASIRSILGLNPQPVTKDQIGALLKGFKSTHNWKNDWNGILKPLYGKDFNALPKGIELMLSPKFDPAAFSVVSYGIIHGVPQGIYAILSKKQLDDGSVVFVPIKSYWIN